MWHFYFQELRKVKLSLPFTPSPLTQDAPGVSTLLSLRFDRFWRLWPPTSYWERTESDRHGWSLCRPAAPWQFSKKLNLLSSDLTAQYRKNTCWRRLGTILSFACLASLVKHRFWQCWIQADVLNPNNFTLQPSSRSLSDSLHHKELNPTWCQIGS